MSMCIAVRMSRRFCPCHAPGQAATGVGRGRLEVARLRLCVQGAEREGRFTRAGDAGEDHQRVPGNLQAHVLEVVLPRTANAHEAGRITPHGPVTRNEAWKLRSL